MSDLDLTPFGFTPTEGTLYAALLELGPSGGYAVARHTGIARANVYQALAGLVAKGAAVVVEEEPKLYRAVRPDSLYALIVERQADRLEQLARQLTSEAADGAPATTSLTSRRSLVHLIGRVAARETGPVWLLAPADVLRELVPVFRKRAAAAQPSVIYDPAPDGSSGLDAGEPPSSVPARDLGSDLVLFRGGAAAGVAAVAGAECRGIWTTEPLLVLLVSASLGATLDQPVG